MKVEKVKLNTINADNVLRYMGIKPSAADEVLRDKVMSQALPFLEKIDGKVCYEVFDIVRDDSLYIGGIQLCSDSLQKHLEGCDRAVVMAATIGTEADRIRQRAAVASQLDELIYDALGTEAIEAVCDDLCERLELDYGCITKRFSPGYGDLSLEYQKDILMLLQADKKTGVGLTDSLLMTPTKSVTAFVGIKQYK